MFCRQIPRGVCCRSISETFQVVYCYRGTRLKRLVLFLSLPGLMHIIIIIIIAHILFECQPAHIDYSQRYNNYYCLITIIIITADNIVILQTNRTQYVGEIVYNFLRVSPLKVKSFFYKLWVQVTDLHNLLMFYIFTTRNAISA